MRIEGDLDNMRIVAPQLRPFIEGDRVVCPACGMKADYWWRRVLRILRGKRVLYVARMSYCHGDKPPKEETNGFNAFLFFGPRENHCSGIPLPHLHCRCVYCNAEWFTELKERG